MNNPFDYTPAPECAAAFRQLLIRLDALNDSRREEDLNFSRELKEGKMLGVLVAADSVGKHHILYAFSGQLGTYGFHFPEFVEPVFDYLQPDGYFKSKERDITSQNKLIAQFEQSVVAPLECELQGAEAEASAELAEYKEQFRRSKSERDARRAEGNGDEAAMIRQSQFEKAELRRLKKRMASGLEPLRVKLKETEERLAAMKENRRRDSEALQQWLFTNFRLLNARGESRSLREIFANTAMKIPPSGAGECCAPKLLQAAYKRGLKPVAMAEYWYGKPKGGELRIHGSYYPACRGKCLPILSWMLQGLDIEPGLNSESAVMPVPEPEIIFENEYFCVVNKPSGVLSVPGKVAMTSVQEWLENRYGQARRVRPAHRIDRDTSGLIIATFGEENYKIMQSLFATRKMKKTYIAELVGDYQARGIPAEGVINLPLSADRLDRPRQRVDFDGGKEAMTRYRFCGCRGGRSRVIFHPLTGRTHQLRVHAAAGQGLAMPIAGDPLYAKNGGADAQRLMLHAAAIEFTYPLDGRHYHFMLPAPF